MGPANVAPWLEQVGDGLAKKVTIGLDAEIPRSLTVVSLLRSARSAQVSSLMIEAEGLTKRYGPTVALAGIDLAPGGLSQSVEVKPRDGGTHPAAAFRLLNNQPGKGRAARPYTEWRRVWPLARAASGTQGWLGLVRRCAVSGAWWRQMA